MAGFPEQRRALTDATFAAFGEDAWWFDRPEPVRVRLISRDEEQGFGGTRIIEKVLVARLRSWEVEQPALDDKFYIEGGPNIGSYTIAAKPMLDTKGVWNCDVEWESMA
jgi:hypothetical protein